MRRPGRLDWALAGLALAVGLAELAIVAELRGALALKVAAELTRTTDTEAISAVLDSPARLQEKIPYVPMKGIEFLLKIAELRDPRAKNFDPGSVVDSSFMQELENSGFIDSLWKK